MYMSYCMLRNAFSSMVNLNPNDLDEILDTLFEIFNMN